VVEPPLELIEPVGPPAAPGDGGEPER